MSDPTEPLAYDAFYYRNCVGGDAYVRDRSWLAFNASVADRIVAEIGPRQVLDAGCGFGFLVEALRARGVEAAGIDVSPYAVQNIHASVREFCWSGSLIDDLPRRYDLIVTIEVLEHVAITDAERVVANLCGHADDVLFSSTPFDRQELTHINVQPPEYWAEHFARHGFYRDVDFDAAFITPWAVRFRKRSDPVHRIIRDYERRFAALQIERNEIRKRAFDIQTRLAHAQAPLHRKAWRLIRSVGGKILRPIRG